MNDIEQTQESIPIFFYEKVKDKYEIISEIGRGGMGVVYKAMQIYPSREVAIKFIPRKQSSIFIKRFEREMEIAASLDHPGITKVYDCIYDNDFMCLVMEYVIGSPLNVYLKENNISFDTKVSLFKEICLALVYAHQNNVIHRDLKPQNILITQNRIPKIIDFGLARRTESRFDLTKSGEILGTPRYMAPEQISGKSLNIDYQSDIYAMGAIFYEMITGKCMINGDSAMEIFYNIKYGKIPPPSQINESVSKEINKIWVMATAQNKKERYQSLQDIVEDIDIFIEGRSIQRSLARKLHYWIASSAAIVIFVGLLFFYANQETKIDFQLGEKETKILDYIGEKKYIEAIVLYKEKENIRYNNLLLESIARCYSQIRKMGIECVESKEIDNAKKYLSMVMEAFPNDVETMSHLAKAHLPVDTEYAEIFTIDKDTIPDMERAKEYLIDCIDLDPYSSKHFLLLGKIELSLGRYQEASQNLQQALELDEQNVEAIMLLCKVPYEEPSLQRQCYQYLFNLVDTFDDLKELDLYKEDFKNIEDKYRDDYLKYIAFSNVSNEQGLQQSLEKIDSYHFNLELEETLVAYRYAKNFKQKLSEYINDKSFLNKILKKSQATKFIEYEKYCLYQIAYMYNHRNWGLTLSESQEGVFKEKLQSIIEETSSNNIFIKFLAMSAYVRRYGFIFPLKEIEKENNSILNKIIITAVMRQMKIPSNHYIYYKYEQVLGTVEEKNFLDYLIANTIFTFIGDRERDTYGRTLIYVDAMKDNIILLADEDKNILSCLSKSEDERTQVSANVSLMGLLDKWKDKALFAPVEEAIIAKMSSADPTIRSYANLYFWSHTNIKHIDNDEKYDTLYLKSLEDNNDEVKKIILGLHLNYKDCIAKEVKKEKENSIFFKLLQEDKDTKQKDRVLRLYAILALSHSAGMKYSELKGFFKNLNSFEQTYAFTINLYSQFSSGKNEEINPVALISSIKERKKDVLLDKEPYIKCFNFYTFSLIRSHFLNTLLEEKVLQTVIYQLYRMPDFGFMNLLFEGESEKNRKEFAQKYFEHENKNIRKYAKSSYVALLSKSEEKDIFYTDAQINNDYSEKKAVALGFYFSLEKKIIDFAVNDFKKFFDIIVTIPPREEYENYIHLLKSGLEEDYKQSKLNNRFKQQQQWIEKANTLDPEESKYYFEKAIFLEVEGKDEEALKLVEQAIKNVNEKEPQQYLYYFKQAELFEKLHRDEEAIDSLNIAVTKMKDFFFLRQVAPMYLRLKDYIKAEKIYSQLLLEGELEGKTSENLGIVAAYIGMGEKSAAVKMFYYINEMYKRWEYDKWSTGVINGITEEIFSVYEKMYPELKELRAMGIYNK